MHEAPKDNQQEQAWIQRDYAENIQHNVESGENVERTCEVTVQPAAASCVSHAAPTITSSAGMQSHTRASGQCQPTSRRAAGMYHSMQATFFAVKSFDLEFRLQQSLIVDSLTCTNRHKPWLCNTCQLSGILRACTSRQNPASDSRTAHVSACWLESRSASPMRIH